LFQEGNRDHFLGLAGMPGRVVDYANRCCREWLSANAGAALKLGKAAELRRQMRSHCCLRSFVAMFSPAKQNYLSCIMTAALHIIHAVAPLCLDAGRLNSGD
jgi:hypothetical protein